MRPSARSRRLLLALGLPALAAACDVGGDGMKPAPVESGDLPAMTGSWLGELNGEPLSMELTEAEDGSVTGTVSIDWIYLQEVYAIRTGTRTPTGALFLDISPCSVGPPVGCSIRMIGQQTAPDSAGGACVGTFGHDPSFGVDWSVARSAP